MVETAAPIPDKSQRLAADPSASVWVSASAGTGKTKVLTERVLGLLLGGTPPERILCLTFTRAAAAQMAGRITDVLGGWTMMDEEDLSGQLEALLGHAPDGDKLKQARRLFALILDAPGGMNIMTIHAFCQSLLRRFPLEARVVPHFSLMDERDSDEMLITARESVLNRARGDGDGDMAHALARLTPHIHEQAFPKLMGQLAGARGRLAHLITRHGGLAQLIEQTRVRLGAQKEETPESILAEGCEDGALDLMGLRLAAQALAGGSGPEQAKAKILGAWLGDPLGRVANFQTYADIYLTQKRHAGPIQIRAKLINKGTSEATPGAEEILTSEAQRLAALLIRIRTQTLWVATTAMITLGQGLIQAYEQLKTNRALLDYEDLILQADRLLHDGGAAPWVLYKLDGGIDHILVDEAQDTNPGQWRIVQALAEEFFTGAGAAAEIRTVFAVGDVKQSIYSFQGADPAAFTAMRDLFADRVPAAAGQWREVELQLSFRSTRAVLDCVDAVFQASGVGDGVALDGKPIQHQAHREGDGGLVELWPPVEPRASDPPDGWKPPVEVVRGDQPPARLARLVAGRIHQMIHEGEILESKGRPVEAGDILVLVRRRTQFADELVRALKQLEIGVAGVDRMVLTEQMAVMDLMAMGHFLLLPEDDLTLATVLKGPLIGLTEEQLFDLAYGRDGTLWDELKSRAGEGGDFQKAYGALAALLAQADFTPPFEIYSQILGALRGREKLLARLGPDAGDPIAEFLNLALSFEASHPPSLQGFLYWLEAGEVEVKRDLEEAPSGTVRIMTVHGAKGLEAPIIFLPDTLQSPATSPSLLWLPDQDSEDDALLWLPRRALETELAEAGREAAALDQAREYRRLLYVAMTRAEDRLYVCGWRTRRQPPEGCWYDSIRAGLEGLGSEQADSFPELAREVGLQPILRFTSAQTAEPPKPTLGETKIWNPLPPWAGTLPPSEEAPPLPLVPSHEDGEEPPVSPPLGADGKERFKRGRLVHALLQFLPGLPVVKRAPAAEAYLARPAHRLGPEEQSGIQAECMAILEDDRLAGLFGEESRAEVSLIGHLGDRIVSGIVDRLLITDERIAIIDYKTNRVSPTGPDQVPGAYLRQMAAYRAVLQGIYPGRDVECALLWTMGPGLMWLDDEVLSASAP